MKLVDLKIRIDESIRGNEAYFVPPPEWWIQKFRLHKTNDPVIIIRKYPKHFGKITL